MMVPELRTKIRTDERKSENYIPVGINAGGIITHDQDTFKADDPECKCTAAKLKKAKQSSPISNIARYIFFDWK